MGTEPDNKHTQGKGVARRPPHTPNQRKARMSARPPPPPGLQRLHPASREQGLACRQDQLCNALSPPHHAARSSQPAEPALQYTARAPRQTGTGMQMTQVCMLSTPTVAPPCRACSTSTHTPPPTPPPEPAEPKVVLADLDVDAASSLWMLLFCASGAGARREA